jgi:hypothetical protein
MGICRRLRGVRPLAPAAFPALTENMDASMSKSWSLLPTPVRDALGDRLDHLPKLQIVEAMPFAGIREWTRPRRQCCSG